MNEDNFPDYEAIIEKVAPSVFECMNLQKQIFKTPAPRSLCEGMVLGFLLGRGFTYQESTVGLYNWHRTMNEMIEKDPEIQKDMAGIVTINSREGISLKEDQVEPRPPAPTPESRLSVNPEQSSVISISLLGRLSQKLPPILMKYEPGFHMSKVDDTPAVYKKEMEIMSLKILCELLQGETPQEHLKGLAATATDLQLVLSNSQ